MTCAPSGPEHARRNGLASRLEGQADCTRCAALCCMAFAFDKGQGFGIDKPNSQACPHLGGDDRCQIHEDREAAGFAACIQYDCGGVGQYLTETVFAGAHWRGDPGLMDAMTAAFSALREIAALSELLAAAGTLPLERGDRAALEAHCVALWPAQDWTPESLAAFEASGGAKATRQFVRSLRRYVEPGGERPVGTNGSNW
ncbi:MAG: hypothetical protein AAF253_04745 [Pseudomonadota bacterium]